LREGEREREANNNNKRSSRIVKRGGLIHSFFYLQKVVLRFEEVDAYDPHSYKRKSKKNDFGGKANAQTHRQT
jgi:hypothetical protein